MAWLLRATLAGIALAGLCAGSARAKAPTQEPARADPINASAAAEPDYEEEKIQFQRGSVMLYTLPQIDAALRARAPTGGQSLPSTLPGLQQAAASNNALALVQRGVLYERGQGVSQDYHAAAELYRQAIALGSPQASFLLGMVYWQGKGVPQDWQQATSWMLRAAQQGLVEAQVNRGWLCEYAPISEQDFACARQWYARAAQAGNATGAFDLGTLYSQGKGVAQNYATAAEWFLRAAVQGHAGAQYNLGVLALGNPEGAAANRSSNTDQHSNPAAAYQWFRLAQLAHYPAATQSVRDAGNLLDVRQIAHAELAVRYWLATHAQGEDRGRR